MMEKILEALRLQHSDPEARKARLKRVEELEKLAEDIRARNIIWSDQDAQEFIRRHHGRH